MDIEKLKALKTAVEIGSITQAAEHMGYSQPGLTGMLKRLEQEIGYPLLRRGTKGVRLTEAGEAVMPYIERILRESDTFEHAVRALRPAQQDELRIGSYTSISKNWLPQVIRGFSRKYPGVRPCISTIATQDSAVIKMGEQGLGAASSASWCCAGIPTTSVSRRLIRRRGVSWAPVSNRRRQLDE